MRPTYNRENPVQMPDAELDMIRDYVVDRFFESQGIPLESLSVIGRSASELKGVVRERLSPAAERIHEDWFASTQDEVAEDPYEPWWTVLERRLLQEIKERLWDLGFPLVQKPYWPANQEFALVVTHDVDSLHPFVTSSSRRYLAHAWQMISLLLGHGPCTWGLRRVSRLDMKLGVPSTFFVMTDYDCATADRLSRLLRYLLNIGFEIGLHASPKCGSDPEALLAELERLERLTGAEVSGVRQHTLAFDSKHTWRLQDEAGLRYDSSFAWNTVVGFRSGSALPFQPLDLSRGKGLGILELPLAYMDWTHLTRNGITSSAKGSVGRLLRAVREVGGLLTVNFHNSYLDWLTHPDIVEHYLGVVREAQASKAWIVSARDCADWWLRRTRASVLVSSDSKHLVVANPSSIPLIVWFPDHIEPRFIRDSIVRINLESREE